MSEDLHWWNDVMNAALNLPVHYPQTVLVKEKLFILNNWFEFGLAGSDGDRKEEVGNKQGCESVARQMQLLKSASFSLNCRPINSVSRLLLNFESNVTVFKPPDSI